MKDRQTELAIILTLLTFIACLVPISLFVEGDFQLFFVSIAFVSVPCLCAIMLLVWGYRYEKNVERGSVKAKEAEA